MSRPIVLPDLPDHPTGFGWGSDESEAIRQAQRAAVEADRNGIVVTDDDVSAAWDAADENGGSFRAALESYAKRLRGETP